MTNFEYEAHSMTGNGNKVIFMKLRKITPSELIFGWFSHLKPLCGMAHSETL